MSEQFYQESNSFAEVNYVLVLVEAVGGQVIGIDVGPGVGKVFGKNTPSNANIQPAFCRYCC